MSPQVIRAMSRWCINWIGTSAAGRAPLVVRVGDARLVLHAVLFWSVF